MARTFLDKYFPAFKAAGVRREICGIQQKDMESLYEYWERFKRLCVSCPQHEISDELLIQYFYQGLLPMEKKMMDDASGGAIVNKTPTQARTLIDTMAENSKQFGVRSDIGRGASELAMGNMPQVKACGFCSSVAHPTDACPTLHEEEEEKVNAIGGGNFHNSSNRAPEPFSSTYNPGWRQHPNLSYAPRQGQDESEGKYECRHLRNGKELQEVVKKKKEKVHEEEEELEVKTSTSGAKDVKEEELKKKTPEVIVQAPPFLSRFEKTKRESEEKEILDTFQKVQVNIPLLDAIKQVPRYAKFFKELCTNKRKLKGNEKISMSQNVSAVLQKQLPPKCKDPGMALKPTSVVIQLADRSIVYPKGVLEDVLVQVNELVFPADFYVIDMEEKNASKAGMLLLG
ncbi:uncharacterized protein LOC112504312 [Cynara cardunculus var. scolymus]|uniref:uncharacterized protein LOC112504312 n=1 Tax=Cynara cardunculus var. scolymus TaxID=59895 RepID=UPI000D62817C|nr:uncharacterized protein LOC112504312 [Cynara cardunculus var. scolymus]